ncbi:CoA ester lyase [Novosphingobium profundi]|uniref:HpcH/HpaI aldolase/citrate lyase family protein n=1 Tax=Novosphingobium profundi TaxID=1774954 RepID=UPI001BD962E3|nr:CoA ester lyase [Novosphingobium profundi]MBT0670141.1 CoA ester lyase [Novosphingobium profundi]
MSHPEAGARIAEARHFLFVPANRPERFANAAGCGADLAILDLEDAVPAADKVAARANVRDWLEAGGQAMVRINAADTPWFEDDLKLLAHPGLIGVMLPKAEPGAALARVAGLAPVLALVESACGVADMGRIAQCEGVVRLALGTIDLALDLGLAGDDRLLDPLRLQMTLASRVARLAPPVEGVTPDFRDEAANRAAMAHGRSFGFAAKMCIHPMQIAPVEAALAPSEAEIEQARRIVAADRASAGAAVALDGAMVDRPIVERAYRLLERLEGPRQVAP